MEKKIALAAIVWIFVAAYWIYQAAKDKVPPSYGLIVGTAVVAIGYTVGWLLNIAFG